MQGSVGRQWSGGGVEVDSIVMCLALALALGSDVISDVLPVIETIFGKSM